MNERSQRNSDTNPSESTFQELFKYKIRFALSLFVPHISVAKENILACKLNFWPNIVSPEIGYGPNFCPDFVVGLSRGTGLSRGINIFMELPPSPL